MADCTHEGVSPVISDKKFMRSNVIQHLHSGYLSTSIYDGNCRYELK